MDWPAYSLLFQLILHIFVHLFITLPCVFLLFKKYLEKEHSPILKIYFLYGLLFGLATVINAIYLLAFFSPNESRYFGSTMGYFGILAWALQFPSWTFEFFICAERCLIIAFPYHYNAKNRTIFCGISIVVSFFYPILVFILDKLPVFLPPTPIPCKFIGCVYDMCCKLVIVHISTISISILNFCCVMLLLVMIKKKLHNETLERTLSKTIVLNTLVAIIFQWLHPIISSISYEILPFRLTLLGPVRFTMVTMNVQTSILLYLHAFRKRFKTVKIESTLQITN